MTTDTQRLVSLDVFRGITIAGMVLVNNPGTWEHIYWPLEHATWSGWTPTDLVFPFFVFIVGVSIPLAFGNRLERGGSRRDLYLKIIKRTLIIFAIGLFLNGLPYFGLAEYRIPGVLQRLAVCYFFASIIFLNTKVRTQIAIAIGLLIFYWLLVSTIPAISTALIGVLTGTWLRTEKTRYEKAAGMFVVGAVCVAIGWAWN